MVVAVFTLDNYTKLTIEFESFEDVFKFMSNNLNIKALSVSIDEKPEGDTNDN